MTLTTEQKSVLAYNAELGTYSGAQGYAYNPANPYFGGVYVLTSKDGTQYRIDAATGDLLTVKDTNGNTLTYTEDAITSSTGQQISFEWDGAGRITSVKDPLQEYIRYTYDANGDLVSVKDRENNTTRLVYDATYDDPEIPGADDGGRVRRNHFLRQIIDPLGRTGARTEYDDRGRLKEMVDANGTTVEFSYDPANSRQTIYDQLNRPTTYEYDDRGNIVTEVDAVGKVTKRKYDSNNYVLEETVITPETGANGFKTTYTYDSKGNQLSRTNPLNETDYYTYTSTGQLLSSTDALGNTTRYTYDQRGNVLSKTDATKFTTTYTYDEFGRNRAIIEAENDITEFEYDSFGNQTLKRQKLGNGIVYETIYTYTLTGDIATETHKQTTPTGIETLVTTKTYDKNGKVKTVRDAENGLTQYEYDANGNQTLVIDPLGRRTVMKYNDKNQLLETIYDDDTPATLLDNPHTQTRYDAVGNKTAIIDQNGQMTAYRYDALNRPTGMVLPDDTPLTDADNPKIDVEYDRLGRMKALVKEGVRSEFEYDAAGRMTLSRVTQNGQVYETRTAYDKAGRAISKTDALNHTTRYVYDAMDRVTETIYADQSRTATTYDGFGNVTSRTDQAGRITRYEYDGLDRLTAVIDATTNRTEYRYDEMGNLVAQKDANRQITNYEYDGLGRRTAVIRPMGERSETTYNAVGNITQTKDFNGNLMTYGYDETNRLTTKTYVTEGRSQQFTYTDTGRLDTYTDERGITDYDYDPMGRLLSRMDPDNRAIGYTYDPVTNKVASVTTPSGTTSYRYNSLGQLEKVISGSDETTYTYNPVGNVATIRLPNDVTQTYQYDNLDRLTGLETKNAAGTVLAKYTYHYDLVGNRTSVEELNGRKVEYAYDQLYRLAQEKITDPVQGNRTIAYTYDAVGNRLTKQDSGVGNTVYTYNANDWLLNQVTNGVSTIYTYDSNGNTKTKTELGEQTVYRWNSDHQLTGATITTGAGTKQLEYRYNANGVRVTSIVDGVETRYLVDENRPYAQVLEEYAPNGVVQARYVYDGNLDLISQTRGGTESIYLRDGHSGVRQLTNVSGAVTDTYAYDSYGNLLQSTGATQNDYLYRGEQSDPNLGMQYLRTRYYDQNSGRFASVDPFEGWQEQPMSRHRYIYGNDSPITYIDPSGAVNTLQDALAAITIAGLLATPIQQSIGFIANKIGGKPVEWEGYSFNIQKGVNMGDLTFSPSFFYATSEAVDGWKTTGAWLIISGGISIPFIRELPIGDGNLLPLPNFSITLSEVALS